MPLKTAKKKKSSSKKANTDDAFEWWSCFQPLIANERVANDGLQKRRDELEAIVKARMTSRKTGDAVIFKGKRRYVKAKSRETDEEDRLVWAAIFALQCLYHLEDAISSADVNAVIHWTYGFTSCDFDVMAIKRCGWDAGCAVSLWQVDQRKERTRHRQRVEVGEKKRGKYKIRPKDEALLSEIFRTHRHQPNRVRSTTHEFRERSGMIVSADTVRRHLRKLGELTTRTANDIFCCR